MSLPQLISLPLPPPLDKLLPTGPAPSSASDSPSPSSAATPTSSDEQPTISSNPTTTMSQESVTITTEEPTGTTTTTTTTTTDPVHTSIATTDDTTTLQTTSFESPTTTSTTSLATTVPVQTTTETTRAETHTRTDPKTTKTKKTTTPYTTRYITTISIVTITTMVPKPTTISGKVTTIYVPETTTSPVPTIIQDPAQEPPPGTRVEEHDQRGREGLAAWKITLIIVACFVVVLAVGAAIFVGRIKKRRRRRDKQEGGLQQQRSEGMFGVYESDLGSKDGKHNTTPEAVSARAFKSDKRGGGWRSKLRVRMPWDEPVMHRDAHLQGQPRQGPSGLWLMEDDGLNGHEEMIAAAAMYPVSYQNVSQPEIGLQPRQRPESGHGQDLMSQEQFLQHGHLRDSSRISYPPTPLPTPLPTPSSFTFPASASIQKGISSTTFASAKTTNSLAAPTLPGPFLEGRISTSTDYADGHGFGHEQRPGNYELNILASALESQRASLVLEFDTANNSGNETPAKRNTIIVDVDQLESNTKFEHVRQGPQAILGSPNSQTTQINTEQQLQKGDEDGCVGNAEAGPSSINKSRNSLSEKDTAAATVNVGSNPIVEK